MSSERWGGPVSEPVDSPRPGPSSVRALHTLCWTPSSLGRVSSPWFSRPPDETPLAQGRACAGLSPKHADLGQRSLCQLLKREGPGQRETDQEAREMEGGMSAEESGNSLWCRVGSKLSSQTTQSSSSPQAQAAGRLPLGLSYSNIFIRKNK